MMGNAFDQFDQASEAPAANPFDQFDAAQGALKATHLGPLNAPLTAFGNFTDQMTRGATLGLSDKAAALADATAAYGARGLDYLRGASQPSPVAHAGESFGDIYHKALEQQRGYGEAYSAAHPIVSPIATGIGLAAAAGSPLYRGAISGKIVPNVLSTTIGNAAKSGATVGGLAGFGASNDESAVQDLKDTAIGAGAGMLAGGAAQAAGPWLSARAGDLLNSPLMHKFQGPAAIVAALEAIRDPSVLKWALPGWLGLQGLSRIPPQGWGNIAKAAGIGAGATAPGLLPAREQSDQRQ